MKTLILSLLIALACVDGYVLAQEETSKTLLDKPNIVYVLFDDMGWGQPTCYNPASELRTPHLDRLAREGMKFTDAHSASAVCTPTRYGLLTGRYPWRIGQFGVLTTYSPPIVPTNRLTAAALLKQHGYATACVGKWHLGVNWVDRQPGTEKVVPIGSKLTDGPNALGFDYFCGFTHARNIGSVIEQDRVVAHVEAVENQPFLMKKAEDWLAKQTPEKPFFLYFPMCPPHTPVVPSPDFAGKSGARDAVKKDPQYGDWVYQGDAMLGRIMQVLEQRGLAESTLLIATSDNGAEGRAYAPLRASKRSIYEGGHRVPCVARWPGKIKPGSVNDHMICHNDLVATIAEMLSAKLPDEAGEDSVSILPELLGSASKPIRESLVHQSMDGDLAIRQGPWKLVFLKNGLRELYNLESDLSETQDRFASEGQVARELENTMRAIIDRGRSTPGAVRTNEFSIDLTGNTNDKNFKSESKKRKKAALPLN